MVKRTIFTLIVTAYFLIFTALTIAYGLYRRHLEQAPDQPVAFQHQVHINQVGLECAYCHPYADKGLNPGIPPVSLCMECHTNVKTDSLEIKTLTRFWENKEPVPWEKVNIVPPHVYFSHKRHVLHGFDCTQCHGDVAGSEKMRQVRSMKMGWCVSCHTKNGESVDCWICHK